MNNTLVIGTRGSKLALWQARWVQKSLEKHHPGLRVTLHPIKTKGDKILDVALAKVGGKGLFVKEIENALLDGGIDLAVHSMKDMPALIPDGLKIGAVPAREAPEDVLISHRAIPFADLADRATIGTSSLRRAAQLLAAKPTLSIQPVRGNLDTRLKKLDQQEHDAIVLAAAGVIRLGLENRITEYLNTDIMLPAVGQGALCIESRTNDPAVEAVISCLNDPDTNTAVTAERAFLKRLEGGCQTPIAAYARLAVDRVHLTGMVASLDGRTIYRRSLSAPRKEADTLGRHLAEMLLDQGAREILQLLKDSGNV